MSKSKDLVQDVAVEQDVAVLKDGVGEPFAAWVGIDRSDKHLDLCLQAASAASTCATSGSSAKREQLRIANTPEAVAEWLGVLRTRFPGGVIAICLEQPAAALLHFLVQCENVVLFPVNPLTLARYREAFTTSRAKDDAGDAAYLLELVRDHRDKLPAWRPDDAATRSLSLLCEGRRKAVDLRTKLCNGLTAHLKSYYPQALELAGGELHIVLACDFLLRWPSLQELKRARPKTIHQFYLAHNSRRKDAIARRLELIGSSVAVSDDAALLTGAVPLTKMYAGQLKELAAAVAVFDGAIEKLFAEHADAFIFASLPGAGPVFSARLLCAFGSDRERYASAQDMEKYSGIAPVIKASGKIRLVQRRFARPLFLHQSFMEYADQSVRHCAWAKAFLRSQRAKGKGHYAAVRALAFKWIRIMFRCWQDKVAYDDEKYVASLREKGSSLVAWMDAASEAVTAT